MVKRVPCAGLGLHVQRAAELLDLGGHHVHADAAAGLLGDGAGGGEARLEDQLHRILVAERVALGDQAERERLVADGLQVHAGAVIGQAHHDLGALAVQLEQDLPGLGLAALHALLGRLDAVHHGVAQHVLERRQHALEHLAVEFAGGALDDELGALAGVGGGLAHDARQALHVALEGHHARAHQAVLQLGDGARLLLQQVLRVLGEVLEQRLDARHVVGGLGQRARELLDGGVAVELERIELAAVRPPSSSCRCRICASVSISSLRSCSFRRVTVRDSSPRLKSNDPSCCSRRARAMLDFAGDVEQLVEQLGVDARHLLRLAPGDRLAARRHRRGRGEGLLGLRAQAIERGCGRERTRGRPGALGRRGRGARWHRHRCSGRGAARHARQALGPAARAPVRRRPACSARPRRLPRPGAARR